MKLRDPCTCMQINNHYYFLTKMSFKIEFNSGVIIPYFYTILSDFPLYSYHKILAKKFPMFNTGLRLPNTQKVYNFLPTPPYSTPTLLPAGNPTVSFSVSGQVCFSVYIQ